MTLAAQAEARPRDRVLDALSLVVLAGFVVCAAALRLDLDYWYDEVRSLQYYQLQPLADVVTEYSEPNNHVLFNLLGNVWLRVIGLSTLEAVLDSPSLVRLPCLVYAVLCGVYVWRTGCALYGSTGGLLALAVLMTTVPFLNLALQVRGYGLGMLLLAALTFHALRLAGGAARPGWHGGRHDALLVVVLTGFALWAVPSHLLGVIGIAAVCAVLRPRALLAFGAGIALAAALYAPVLPRVVDNRFVRSHGAFESSALTQMLPRVLDDLLSARWLLAVAVLVAPALALRGARAAGGVRVAPKNLTWAFAVIVITPFLVSYVRGDRPFPRTFVQVCPAFAVLAGGAVAYLIARIELLAARRVVAVAVVLACAISFAAELIGIDRALREDIDRGGRAHDLYRLHFQHHYQPSRIAELVKAEAGGFRVLLGEVDAVAMPAYLSRHGVAAHKASALPEELRRERCVYLVTAWPRLALEKLAHDVPEAHAELRNVFPSFHNVIRITVPGQ